MKAYRIVKWRALYEVDKKGKPAAGSTPDGDLRNQPHRFIRCKRHGYHLGPTYRKMIKLAWSIGPLMDMACFGFMIKLLELAGSHGPEKRGWILDEKGDPVNVPQIAELLDIQDDGHLQKLMDILCLPAVGWVELADYPYALTVEKREEGEGNRVGEISLPFKNVTETNNKLNNNVRDGGEEDALSPGPAPVMDSDSASEITGSVTDTGPERALGIKKERQKALLELCEIIPARDSSDATTFRDIFEHLEFRMLYETDEDLFARALDKARQCRKAGQKPAAMFVAGMKLGPFGYIPKGRQVIGGQLGKSKH